MTVAVIDTSTFVSALAGEQRALDAWDVADAVCMAGITEVEASFATRTLIEHPSMRMLWIWMLHETTAIAENIEIRSAAAVLASRGCPPLEAMHLATAAAIGADIVATANPHIQAWVHEVLPRATVYEL